VTRIPRAGAMRLSTSANRRLPRRSRLARRHRRIAGAWRKWARGSTGATVLYLCQRVALWAAPVILGALMRRLGAFNGSGKASGQ